MTDSLERKGFDIVSAIFDQLTVLELRHALAPLLETSSSAGVRKLASRAPCIRALARSAEIRSLVEPVLGRDARMVRSILFNKSPDANWQVAWHQDLAIAVRTQVEVPDFVSWSVKEGVPHVQPPAWILERMLTVRLHLDAADESNGALWVSPGSHRLGRLPAGEAADVAERMGRHLCAAAAGDLLMFRPLILHCSRKSVSSRPRRVIHFEFADVDLPAPLVWAESLS